MKLIAVIQEGVHPDDDFIIVKFRADKTSQHFQVFLENPYGKRIRKLMSAFWTSSSGVWL